MFPVKKAEENKFILTAPTEFPSPKFVLLVLCSPVCCIQTAGCSRPSAEEELVLAGTAAFCFCSPSPPSLSFLSPGFKPVSTRAENTGEHVALRSRLLVSLWVGMSLILAAPPSALPQDSQQLQELCGSKTSFKAQVKWVREWFFIYKVKIPTLPFHSSFWGLGRKSHRNLRSCLVILASISNACNAKQHFRGRTVKYTGNSKLKAN